MSHGAKQIWKDILASLGAIAMLVAAVIYISDIKSTGATNDAVHDNKLQNLEAAIGAIPGIEKRLGQIEINTAVQSQLLESLARDRFQYDPMPSKTRALQTIASSTP